MADQTTASILNAAIQHIRDVADSAANNHLDDELCCWDHERIGGHERIIEIRAMPDGNDEDVIAVPTTSGVAEHIALWDPITAHLVTDLLEQIANCGGVKNTAVMRVVNSAAALAKRLNGDREHYNANMHTTTCVWVWEYAAYLDKATCDVATASDLGELKKQIAESFPDHTWEEVERRGIRGTSVLVGHGNGRYADTGHWVYRRPANERDAGLLTLVQARAATDNGNRTPLADVLAEHGLTEADMEVEG